MADYRNLYKEFRATGTSVAAISVDAPETSEALRRELDLPFPILSDTDRRVVQAWDIYNAREKGGIAKPATFVIERDRTVRYASVDGVAMRVSASEILRREGGQGRRKMFIPRPADWFRGIRNMMRR